MKVWRNFNSRYSVILREEFNNPAGEKSFSHIAAVSGNDKKVAKKFFVIF
jgi:hypothetical protein